MGKAKKKATVVRFEEKVKSLLSEFDAPTFPEKIPLRLSLNLRIHNCGKRDIDNHTKSLIDALNAIPTPPA
jgi:Holliday junction resolvase RusA-like endonuclease